MAVNQHNNKCYSRVYTGDLSGVTLTVNGQPIQDNIGGDTVVGIKQLAPDPPDEDVFGNQYFNVVSRYVRSGLYNGQKDASGNIISDPKGGYTGNDNYVRCSSLPVLDASTGKLKGDPCGNPSGTEIPDGAVAPNTCSVFAKDAAAWDRKTMDVVNNKGVIVLPGSSVTNSEGVVVNGPAPHDAKRYGEYDANGNLTVKDFNNPTCAKQNPFTVLVPVDAGNLFFTYMNGDVILTIEGDTVTSAVNTTILVPEEEVV